ncbi:COPII coat assembly protein SEC16 [Spathaspora sp. JA1]|nr:COPII coat assembly protein SEC16 [Spathaspora sp. JA1]
MSGTGPPSISQYSKQHEFGQGNSYGYDQQELHQQSHQQHQSHQGQPPQQRHRPTQSHSTATGHNPYQPSQPNNDNGQDLDLLLDQELDALVSNDGGDDNDGQREHLDNWMSQQQQHVPPQPQQEQGYEEQGYESRFESTEVHNEHQEHQQAYEEVPLEEEVHYQQSNPYAPPKAYEPERDHSQDTQENPYEPPAQQYEVSHAVDSHEHFYQPPQAEQEYQTFEEHGYQYDHQQQPAEQFETHEQNLEQHEQHLEQHGQFEQPEQPAGHEFYQPEQHQQHQFEEVEHQQPEQHEQSEPIDHEFYQPEQHQQHQYEQHEQHEQHGQPEQATEHEFYQPEQQQEHEQPAEHEFYQSEQYHQEPPQQSFQQPHQPVFEPKALEQQSSQVLEQSTPMEQKHSSKLEDLFAKEGSDDFLDIVSPQGPKPAETPAALSKFADLVLDDDLLLDDEFLDEEITVIQTAAPQVESQEQPQKVTAASRYQPPVQQAQPVQQQHYQQPQQQYQQPTQPALPPVQPAISQHHSYVPNSTVKPNYVVTPHRQPSNEFVKNLEESKKKHDAYDFPDTLIHQTIKPAPRHVTSNKYAPGGDSNVVPPPPGQAPSSLQQSVAPEVPAPKSFFEELPIDLPQPSRAARPVALPVKHQPPVQQQQLPPPTQIAQPQAPPVNPYKPKSGTSPIVHQQMLQQQPLLPKPPVPAVMGNSYLPQQLPPQPVYRRSSTNASGGSSYNQSPQPMYAPPAGPPAPPPPAAHGYAPQSTGPTPPQPFPLVSGASMSGSIVPQPVSRQTTINTNVVRTQGSNSVTSPYVPKAGPYAPQSQSQRTHSRTGSLVVGGRSGGKEGNPYAPVLPPVDSNYAPHQQHGESLLPPARTRGFSGASRSGNIYNKSLGRVMSNEELMHRQFPIFNWSSSQNVVSVIPRVHFDQPPIVSVKSVAQVLQHDREIYSEFPGPLTKTKTKKKDIEKWLQISTNYLARVNNKPDEALLNQVLLQLIKHDGNVKSPEFLRGVCSILNPGVNFEASDLPISGIVGVGATNAYRLDNSGINTVFSLIQAGNLEKALEFTISRGDWALALVVANFSGPERFAKVASEYARNSFPFQKSNNKVMHIMPIILKVIAGNVQSVIEDLTAVANEGEYANLHWREIVSTVAISGSIKTGEFLVEFGKFLSSQYHNQIGCDVSYILAGLSFGKHASFMVLLSGEHSMYTQIYEYILTCQANNNMPPVPFPHLLSLKLKHASTLADYGLLNEAQKYADYINNAIKTMGNKSPYISPNLVSEFEKLLERVNESGSLGESGWFGGKMGKVNFWGQIDKFIVGGNGDDTNVKKSGDNGVFSKFSPSVSRNTSTVDFGAMQSNNYNSPMTRMSDQFGSQQQHFSSVSSAPSNRKPTSGYPPQLQSFPSHGSVPTLNKYSPGQPHQQTPQQVKGPQKYTPSNSSQHSLHEQPIEHKLVAPQETQVKNHSPLAQKQSLMYGHHQYGSSTSISSQSRYQPNTVHHLESSEVTNEVIAPPPPAKNSQKVPPERIDEVPPRRQSNEAPPPRRQSNEAPPPRRQSNEAPPPRKQSHELPPRRQSNEFTGKRHSVGELPPPKKQSVGEVHHEDIPPPPPHKKLVEEVAPPPPHKKSVEEVAPPPPHKKSVDEVAPPPPSPPPHKRMESVDEELPPPIRKPVEEAVTLEKEEQVEEEQDEYKQEHEQDLQLEQEQEHEHKEHSDKEQAPAPPPPGPPKPVKSAPPRINPYAPNANVKPKVSRNKYGPPSDNQSHSRQPEETREAPSNFDMYSYGGYQAGSPNKEEQKPVSTVEVKQEDEQKEQEKEKQRSRDPTRNIPNVDDSFDGLIPNTGSNSQLQTPRPHQLTLNQFAGPNVEHTPAYQEPSNQKFGFDGFPIPGSPEYTTRANSVIGGNPPPSGLFSSRLSQSQQSQMYQQYEVEDDTVKDYVPIAEDDDEDDEDVKLAKKKLQEKAAKLKKQQEHQQRQQQQQHRGKGEDGRWFNFLGKNNDGKPKPTRANLGEKESLFYYDEERKRWLDKTKPVEEQLKEAETPPPPMMKKKAPNGPSPLAGPPTTSTSGAGAPALPSGAIGNPTRSGPPKDSGANPEAGGSAPPPKTNTTSLATANLDNLLAMSAAGSSSSRRAKRNTKRTRVNVLELSS